MTVVLLARHGESDWNSESRWQGQVDRPLTDRGREQAALLAERLAPLQLSAIYASDLARAHATAEAVAGPLGLPVRALPALREIDVGSWAGLTYEEIADRHPAGFEVWQAGTAGWEGGETYERFADRALAAVATIAAEHDDAEHVLAVTHGDLMAAVEARATGADLARFFAAKAADELGTTLSIASANCAVARLLVDRGAVTEYKRLNWNPERGELAHD